MFLHLIPKIIAISETLGGEMYRAGTTKRIASLEREANIQREHEENQRRENANTNASTPSYEKLADTQLDTEFVDGAGAPLTVLEKRPPKA